MVLLMMFNRQRRWFQSSRVKLPFVKMSASWVFGINVFDLDFGNSVKRPIKRDSVRSGHVSHRQTCLQKCKVRRQSEKMLRFM